VLLTGLMLAGVASAADLYVATNGNDSTHSSWSTAYTNVQDALHAATSGDRIYVAGHTFSVTNSLSWTGVASFVTIRGGYAATNDTSLPGSNNPTLWPTVFRRASGLDRVWSIMGVTNGTLSQVTITGGSNTVNGNVYGGGLYLANTSSLAIDSCVITGNVVKSTFNHGYAYGGGLFVASGSSAALANCLVARNKAISWGDFGTDTGFGGGACVNGTAMWQNCVISLNEADNEYNSGAYVAYHAGKGAGLYAAGTVTLSNCLLNANRSWTYGDAIYCASGTLRLDNCTIADHGDDGIYQAAGTVSVSNSILWNNGDDIVGTVTLDHSSIEDCDNNGTNGCSNGSPLFEYGYYIGSGSPCTNAGSVSAAAAGLDARTTRADGQPDSGQVDLGYHYPAGADLSVADLYVAPSPQGSDGNPGTTEGSPLGTIGKAIFLARDGTRIHVASGAYTTNLETFPLTVDGKMGLQILGTNRASTVVNAAGSHQRVVTLLHTPRTRIEGVSVVGGIASNTALECYGGGLYTENCAGMVLADCVVSSNRVQAGLWHGHSFGGGVCCMPGAPVVLTNCVVAYNQSFGCGDFGVGYNPGDNGFGGGVAVLGTVTMSDCEVFLNEGDTSWANTDAGRGGGVYTSGSLLMRNCLLYLNRVAAVGWGDAVYVGGGTCGIQNCTISSHSDDGIRRAAGTAWVSNSVVWDNGDDITGVVALAYSSIQDGDSNGVNGCISTDPFFEYGYYLGTNSLCVNAGSTSAAAAGLSNRTTRADGQPDTGLVDLGYHYGTAANMEYADIYVVPAPTGNDGNTGTNPAAPLATITKALSLAQNGTRIHVASGTYSGGSETFPLTISGKANVQLLGAGRETTVINASGRGRVLTLYNAANARVEGLTLTGGVITNKSVNSYGGGVFVDQCGSVSIASCAIISNRVEAVSPANHVMGYGGGIYLGNASLTVSNCVISNNTAVSRGDFSSDSGRGGGLYSAGVANVLRCIFAGNVATNSSNPFGEGGGVFGYGAVSLNACLFHHNRARSAGDAIAVRGGQMSVEGCTMVNHARDGIWQAAGAVAVTNSILWNNGDDVVGTVSLTYSDIEDGDNNGTNGCISIDPLFVDASVADYRLTKFSPCINAGTNGMWMAGALDLDGNFRVRGGKVDMGAYECQAMSGTMLVIR
jgi:hypothetical protein